MEEKNNIEFVREINMKYTQKTTNYCVGCSFGSALHFFGYKHVASGLFSKRKKLSILPGDTQMSDVLKYLKNRFVNDANVGIEPWNRSSSKLDLDNLPVNTIALLIPLAEDGGVQHAIAVVHHKKHGMLVFGSNDDHPMKYSKNAFDFCCVAYNNIQQAIIITIRKKN